MPTLAHRFPGSLQQFIAWQAATLEERIAATRDAEPCALDADGRALVDRWARLFAGGDEAAFLRRLRWDGLTMGDIARALHRPPPAGWLPQWSARLPRISQSAEQAARDTGTPAWEEEVRSAGGEEDVPFADVWLPFLRLAREGVAGDVERAHLQAPARAAFERALVRDLAAAGSHALLEQLQQRLAQRGDTSQADPAGAYQRFVRELLEDGLTSFFATYPPLARHLVRLVDSWRASLAEMLSRLERDRALLEVAFGGSLGGVAAAVPALSDRHDQGRQVALLEFDSGLRMIYKPRDLGLEAAFQDFVRWCRDRGLADLPQPLAVIERPGYGWMECVSPESFDAAPQVDAYYRRAGGLACVAHLLRAHDLHGENIIAAAGGPALVDGEALLQPVAPAEEASEDAGPHASGAAGDEPTSTCLFTGLVTLRHPDAAGEYSDVGGLMPVEAREGPRPRWRHLRTDRIRCNMEREARAPRGNLVMLGGRAQPPHDHAPALVEGFRRAYLFLLERREEVTAAAGPLTRFQGHASRVVFRQSDRYAVLLGTLDAARHWRSGVDRSIGCDVLNRVFARELERPTLWPMVSDERRALEEGDIPRFTVRVDEGQLTSRAGERTSYFRAPGLAAAADRFARMSGEDLASQEAWLEGALHRPRGRHEDGPRDGAAALSARGTPDPRELLDAAAERLGQELVARASIDRGVLGWRVLRGREDLYGGRAGIGLFFAALSHVHGGDWARLARDTYSSLVQPRFASAARSEGWTGIGGASGLGSIIYALAVGASFLDSPEMLERARALSSSMKDEEIATAAFDVMDGQAGALLALLAVHALSGDARVLDRAAACARALVRAQQRVGPGGAWPSRDARFRAGFGHGAAGAACALARFAAVARSSDAARAARAALAWERSVFSLPDRNWPAIRADGGTAVMTAWCHGAAGIAIARATMGPAVEEPAIDEEVRQAAATTALAGAARLDHLCCGTLSRAEALLVAGGRLGSRQWEAQAVTLAIPVAERVLRGGIGEVRTAGFEYGLFQPGFFQGVAGIGYQLLRLARPAVLPSVAGFECRARRP